MSILLFVLAQAAAPAAAPPPPCQTEEHRQFDFWVGEWEVTPNIKGAKPVASSRVEKLYGGCAIRENWMPFKGTGGGSLNSFDPGDGRWHQAWVDSTGTRVDFDGGAVDGVMVLTGLWRNVAGLGKHALVRMSYSRQPDGAVRQHGEQSDDHGLTWKTSFDLLYRAKPAQ